jgi:hypothetical protein
MQTNTNPVVSFFRRNFLPFLDGDATKAGSAYDQNKGAGEVRQPGYETPKTKSNKTKNPAEKQQASNITTGPNVFGGSFDMIA